MLLEGRIPGGTGGGRFVCGTTGAMHPAGINIVISRIRETRAVTVRNFPVLIIVL